MIKISAFTFGFLILFLNSSNDIAQWRGPDRDGIYPDKNLLKEWPSEGPELELKIEGIGKDYLNPLSTKT